MKIPIKYYEKIDERFHARVSIGKYLTHSKEVIVTNEGGTLYVVYTING